MSKRIIIVAAGILTGIGLVYYWKNRWYKINAPLGEKLGYPDCCIKAFCNQPPELLKLMSVTENDRMRYNAAFVDGQYTGFIPCTYHAKKIMKGEITLTDLIKDRDIDMPPFPNL